MRRATVAAIIAAAALAAAGGSSSSSSATVVRCLQRLGERRRRGARHRAPWLPREHHARAGADRREERLLHQGPRQPGTLKTTVYTSGTQETTAILAGQIDAAYVGPEPGHQRLAEVQRHRHQDHLRRRHRRRVVVVKPEHHLRGAAQGTVAGHPVARQHPGRGGALLAEAAGLATSTTGGGDVAIKPTTPNSASVLEFKSGQIAGASEPSPYDVEMVQDGGKVLLSRAGRDDRPDGHPVAS